MAVLCESERLQMLVIERVKRCLGISLITKAMGRHATVWRIWVPDLIEGFEKARQAWAGCGCATRSAILVYAQARQALRQPKITAAFFEPNSPHCRGLNI